MERWKRNPGGRWLVIFFALIGMILFVLAWDESGRAFDRAFRIWMIAAVLFALRPHSYAPRRPP